MSKTATMGSGNERNKKMMRELNDMELEQVAGGLSWSLNIGTQAQSIGGGTAIVGGVETTSTAGSVLVPGLSASFASNKTIAAGVIVDAQSSAASTSGTTFSATN